MDGSRPQRTTRPKIFDRISCLSIIFKLVLRSCAVSSCDLVRWRQSDDGTMVSAYFNTPPANELDERICAGLLLLTGLTPNIKDPKDGVTIPPFRPTENYHFETKGPAIIAALSVCIVLLTIIAFLRLGIRLFVHAVRFGADDWLVIPAYLLSIAYPALQIAMVKHGGAGKHFYDITYQEYRHYKYVSSDLMVCIYAEAHVHCSSHRWPRSCSTSM